MPVFKSLFKIILINSLKTKRENLSLKFILNKKFLGILISLLFIGIIFAQVDVGKTIRSFGLMNPVYIIPIIPVYFMAFVLRALRWKIFLHNPELKFNSLLSSIFIGFSLNCILPARAGEIYRAYFFSKKENLNKTKVFTSVILERIFDGVTLFLILVAAICFISPGKMFSKIALSAGVVFFSGFIFMLALAKVRESGSKRKKLKEFIFKFINIFPEKIKKILESAVNKIFSITHSFIEGIAMLDSWGTLLKTMLISLLVWLMEGSSMLLVIKSFGIKISLLGVLLVLSVTAFSSLIPAGPAGIGPYQWGYMIALRVFGVEPESALAVSVINQLLSIFLVLLAGAFFVWKDHLKLDEIKQNLEEKQKVPDF